MISRLDQEFTFFQKAIDLRSMRQQVLASNIANADTPNYKARDFDFASALKNAFSRNPGALDATDSRHMQAAGRTGGVKLAYSQPYQASLDNNTVEMDVERNKYMDNSIHYEAVLTALTDEIKTMLTAITG